ncbi:MAG: signal peptidase II [Candidatus Shapirobacteria bacterium]|jgi:lipoprotein signal peptidase|nr:signal peptidase II [Candidatus Shapirobacteria bacterium]
MIINRGASLGLNLPFLEWIQLFILIILGAAWWRDKKAFGWLLMIMGGSLNLIERWRWGGVRDYWSIPLTSIYNNLNDYLIAFGVVQLIIYYIWKKRQK